MNPLQTAINQINRRTFLKQSGAGLGMAALASLLNQNLLTAAPATQPSTGISPAFPTSPPR